MVKDRQQLYVELSDSARSLARQGRYQEAIDEWQKVRELCAGHSLQEFSALNWIADCCVKLERYPEAVAALEEIVTLKQQRMMAVQKDLALKIAYVKSIGNGAQRAPRTARNSPKRRR